MSIAAFGRTLDTPCTAMPMRFSIFTIRVAEGSYILRPGILQRVMSLKDTVVAAWGKLLHEILSSPLTYLGVQ